MMLSGELLSRKCAIFLTDEGEVHRAVAVAAVNLTNHEGLLLVQLAKWENQKIDLQYKIPGSAVCGGKSIEDVIDEILNGRLSIMASGIRFDHVERETNWKTSHRYQIKTKVDRVVQFASFRENFQVPDFPVLPRCSGVQTDIEDPELF